MTVSISERYEQERKKRQDVSKGMTQYLGKDESSKYMLSEDPWIPSGTPVNRVVPDGGHVKFIIFGAGFGGLLSAIKLLEAGAAGSPTEILIVDPAGGYGGTWYWNRYPGLMCDVESYVYLPLLEETGFVPSRRYASGEEIRGYIELLVRNWHLEDRGMFQSQGRSTTWDSDHWVCEIVEKPKGGQEQTVKINADYVILGSGTFTYPKIPNLPGASSFKGKMLHTARWNYDVTGGSPKNPEMHKLADKKVAIVGTGATAIQVVPELAKYAQELYVVQRTAAAVDYRGNRDTDVDEWKSKIATKKKWQSERADNLQMFTEQSNDLPEKLVDDGFSAMPSIAATFGGPSDVKPEDTAKHMEDLRAIDDARADRIRRRTEEIVKDPETAKGLQAWYPGFCKRPTFHDEYLPAFNRSNVHLINLDGEGLEDITADGIKVRGKEYPIDVIVWGTGYGNPLTESLAGKAEMTVKGKNDADMEALSKAMDLQTLHGVIGHNFPNLFLLGLAQAGVGVNQVQRIEAQANHNAKIIADAERKVGSGKKAVIEPTEEACKAWGDELASRAHLTSGILSCLPGYFTLEGDVARLPQEALGKMARAGLYGQGYLAYARILQEWRDKGDLAGLNVEGV